MTLKKNQHFTVRFWGGGGGHQKAYAVYAFINFDNNCERPLRCFVEPDMLMFTLVVHHAIGLYRDVWIAAIASSRTSLATLTGVMCNASQCELRSLRVNSGMLNVIRIVTYYTLPPLESPDSFWIAMAFSR